ncbi:phage/plasmid replication protein [uncultured Aquitalea sp.]|nr:phage/plasmid replication protein [uncultured Aquitalea sp.]
MSIDALAQTRADFRFLLFGHDTVQCAYYLARGVHCIVDFSEIALHKERLRHAKQREGVVLRYGSQAFKLQAYGSGSGYPFVLENAELRIECGEFNNPSFFVTFRSQALWQYGTQALHQRFMQWVDEVGLVSVKPPSLSRVDFTFDYHLPERDFDLASFVSLAGKDSQYRENGTEQTFSFGKGDVMLRVYDKISEIAQQSDKVWFFPLWGVEAGVWRIEWQVRKALLKRFGIRTMDDLFERQADCLRYLAAEHDSISRPNQDSNRSRWPLHPLWTDLLTQIDALEGLGVYREIDAAAVLQERLMRVGISLYGYAKRVAAIECIQQRRDFIDLDETLERIGRLVYRIHDAPTWKSDVEKRINDMRLGL